MVTTNLTQEDDSTSICYTCAEEISVCKCFESDIEIESDNLVDSELLEDIEYTRLRRLHPTEFIQVGGVRDF